MTAGICFFNEKVKHRIPRKTLLKKWIFASISDEGKVPGEISIILTDDQQLLERNIKYLKHNTLTDIITFPNLDMPGHIQGDIFISVERVRENGMKFGEPFEKELRRVIIHGILHLVGYKDKTRVQKLSMREKEDHYLDRYQLMDQCST